MVNENLKLIENKKPTETVYEVKTSKLSLAARNKVIKKHGGDYVSERAFSRDISLYGPGCFNFEIRQGGVYSGYFFKLPDGTYTSKYEVNSLNGVRDWLKKMESGEIIIVEFVSGNYVRKKGHLENSIKESLRERISEGEWEGTNNCVIDGNA